MIMTSKNTNQSYGLPAPVTELTMEQDLKLRLIADRLKEGYHDHREDITTLILALQHQNFVLANSLTNLVEKWPIKIQPDQTIISEVGPMFGILLETKD